MQPYHLADSLPGSFGYLSFFLLPLLNEHSIGLELLAVFG